MRSQGGRGLLPGGVPGVEPARVVIIGGGVAGTSAAVVAIGMGADVTVLDTSVDRLRYLDSRFGGRVKTVASSGHAIERLLPSADLVIGAVLIPGAKAPTLVSTELVEQLQAGTVLVDVAVDQGGCFEDTRPTTHREPTYTVHESLFYCVANMPGAVPRSSTIALSNVTAPYVAALANLGWERALSSGSALAHGLNAVDRQLTNTEVGRALGLPSVDPTDVLVA